MPYTISVSRKNPPNENDKYVSDTQLFSATIEHVDVPALMQFLALNAVLEKKNDEEGK